MFAAQLGWLSATPDGQNEARHEMFGVELPDLPAEERLAEIWHELGRSGTTGDGRPVPIDWREMAAFGELSGEQLSAEEWRTLRAMSVAYVGGLGDRGPLSIAPMERNGPPR